MQFSRDAVIRCAACLVLSFAICRSAAAQSNLYPCGYPVHSSFNYPVIVYDAGTRISFLAYKEDVEKLKKDHREDLQKDHHPIEGKEIDALSKEKPSPSFLCDGRSVEIYILNRRLLTSFTVSLTAAIESTTGHLAISGVPSSSAQSPSSSTTTSAPTTPAAKGFAPVAAGTNLLTTDQIIGYFLNEETFDRPVAKIMDDAAAVVAQAKQFAANYSLYISNLNGISAPSAGDKAGNATLPGVTDELNQFRKDVDISRADDETFSRWTEKADSLQGEVTRINTKLQDYPVVDALINMRASAATLNDNVRGVRNEFVSLELAKELLLSLIGAPNDKLPDYLDSRAKAELRIALRARYPVATVDEPTLSRILDEYNPTGIGRFVLKTRLSTFHLHDFIKPWIDEMNGALVKSTPMPAGWSANCGPCMVEFAPTDPLQPTAINLDPAITTAASNLDKLREGITKMNQEEALTLEAINVVYDTAAENEPVLTLNLTGYPKNLFVYYTISGSPKFYRYRIINETPQPESGCTLTISANVSASGGALPCTTAASNPPPPALASFAGTAPLSAAASAQPAATGASTPPSQTSSGTSPSPSASPATSTVADYYGHFERHHFSSGALVTGFVYDSIPNQSFSWFSCPMSVSTSPGGSAGATAPCFSPTPAAGATAVTNYELIQTKQPQVGAAQGINIYFIPKDTFTTHTTPAGLRFLPAAYLGAAIYPLNHYYAGLSVEPIRELTITGGVAYGAETVLPSNYSYTPGTVVTPQPALLTTTRFRAGFFIMVGFHTSLFKAIFNGSAFQSTFLGTAGSPPSGTTGSSSP